MSQPFLSVIVPCYKTAGTMRTTIDSILAQGDGVEIVVANDGSPDETKQIAAEYGNRIIYVEQKNQGVAAARNLGLTAASGRFVQFLDADDMLLPGMVDAYRNAAAQTPETDVWFAEISVADDEMRITHTLEANLDASKPVLSQLLKHNHLMPQGTIVKTEFVKKIGGLDNDLAGVDDWDLWVRLAEAGAKFQKLEGQWAIWRFRTGSQSKQFIRFWNLHRAFFRKHQGLYQKHTTKEERAILLNHSLDRDLPHLYGDDLNKPWIQRRVGRTVAVLKAAPKAKGLVPLLFGRLMRKAIGK